MFNIYLGIYIVFAIVLIGGGTSVLFTSSRSISAVLFLGGALAIFSIFGIRWFGSDKSLFSQAPVSWPPVINTCPDYLMYYKRKRSDGSYEDTCVDKLGVSKNGSLKVIPGDGNINDGNDEYFFSLTTKSSDSTKKKQELCMRAIQYGLTWEGITNGESCIGQNGNVEPPTPPSNNCPQ